MNRIEQLIEELCPEGVEWKELSKVAEIGTGSSNGNEATDKGKYPLYVRSKIVKRIDTFEFDEEAIIIPGEGGIGEIFHYINGKYALHQRAYRIHLKNNEISTKFLCYYMMSNFKDFILQKAVNATVISIRKPMIEKFPVPIPPLPVQREIVTILDTFTALDASLQAELEARRKQYEHYRNQLLNFEGKEVEWKTLGEVCEFVRGPFGGAIKKNCFVASGYAIYEQQHAIYGNTDIRYFISDDKFKELKRFEVFPGDLIMSCSGTMGKIAIIPENAPKGVINQALLKLTVKNEISAKYLKYYFENTITQQMNDEARGGAIKNVASVDVLKKIKMPVPPLSEQERIVGILDKFDALVNTELPAEIAARRKQYEYYREKLLTFEPLAN